TPRLLGETGAPVLKRWYLSEVDGALVGIGRLGELFRYELGAQHSAERWQRGNLPNELAGANPIMFIEAVGPEAVVGSNYSQQNLFVVNPKTGQLRYSPHMIASETGEAMCGVALDG